MSLLSRFLGGRASPRPAANTQFAPASVMPSSAQHSRRELLKVVLRDGLRRHGISHEWITGEALTSTSRHRESGLHWRLTLRHWDARLPALCVALQNSLMERLQGFDPSAPSWLQGISWEFALADESDCPALPPPSAWQPAPEAAPAAAAVVAATPAAGPAGTSSDGDVKADLEKLMAALDAQYAQAGPHEARGYAATEPAGL